MYFQVCELLFKPHHKTLALRVDMRFYVDISDGANLNVNIYVVDIIMVFLLTYKNKSSSQSCCGKATRTLIVRCT